MRVSVVMPVYNECWTIREIVRRVLASPEPLHEVVVVDDGSTDGTRERLRELAARHGPGAGPLRLILREKNGGKGAALRDGFAAVTGDLVIVQDADLEYDPQDYPALVRPLRDGNADAVYGSRFLAGEKRVLLFWHMLANRLLTLLCNLVSNLNLSDVWTGYKAFRADIIRKIPIQSRGFDFEPEITLKLAMLGCRIYEVPVRYHGRGVSEGKKIGFSDAWLGLWRTLATALAGDLGELAVGEQTLRIMAKAQRYNAYIHSLYRERLGRDVVEVGAGVGNVSRFLLDRDRLTLTEDDASYVEQLSRAYAGWDYVQVRRLDIEKPDPGAASLRGRFDTAVCFNVIEHVEDDAAAAQHVADLLKPEGRAVLIVPAHQAVFGTLDKNLGHYRRYDKTSFSRLMAGAGLEVEECRYLNPLAIPAWWFNGKVLRRRVIPGVQLALNDLLTPLIALTSSWGLPFGLSLYTVARKPAARP